MHDPYFRHALPELCQQRDQRAQRHRRSFRQVSLKEGSAEVSYDREVDETELKEAVEKAGFKVISIS